MLETVYRRAHRVTTRHRLVMPVTELMVDHILEVEHLVIVPNFPLRGRVKEVTIGRYVFVQNGLDSGWRKWVKIHAMYHRLYHTGNQLYFDQTEPVLKMRQECQANTFAGFVLVGGLPSLIRVGLDMGALAEYAEVPVECLQSWWLLVEDWVRGI